MNALQQQNQDACICHYVAADGQQYIWQYRAGQADNARRQVGLMASDPQLDFSWDDAASVVEMMRDMERRILGEEP